MPVTNEKRARRRRYVSDRVGEMAVPYEVDNPAWQSNSKVGSRYRVENNKASYTWKYKNEGGLTEREIERLPILGSRGDFNSRPISKIVVKDGLQSIYHSNENSKKYRYKSLKASEGALKRNNWVIYVQIAIAAANQYHTKQIKYPEAISDLVLQAMFHASELVDGVKEPKPLNPILYIFYNPWSFNQYVAPNVPSISQMVENEMKQNRNFFDGNKTKFFRAWEEFCRNKSISASVMRNGQKNWDRFGDHSTDLAEFIQSRNNMIERGVLNPSLRVLNQITNAGTTFPGAIPVAPSLPTLPTSSTVRGRGEYEEYEEYGFDTFPATQNDTILPPGYVRGKNGEIIPTSSNLPPYPATATPTVSAAAPIVEPVITPIVTPIINNIIVSKMNSDQLMRIILNTKMYDKSVVSLYENNLKVILSNPNEANLYFNEMQSNTSINYYMTVSEFKKLYESNSWLSDVNIDAFVRNFNYESLLNKNKPYFISPLGWTTHFDNSAKSDNIKKLLKEHMDWVICPVAINTVNSHWYVIHVQFTKEPDGFDYKIIIHDSLKTPTSNPLGRYTESLQKIRQTINELYLRKVDPSERRPSFQYGGDQKDGSSCGLFAIFTMLLLHNGIGMSVIEREYYENLNQDRFIQQIRQTFAGYLATKLKEIKIPVKRRNEPEVEVVEGPQEKRRKTTIQPVATPPQTSIQTNKKRATVVPVSQPPKTNKKIPQRAPSQRTKKLPGSLKEFIMK